MSDCKMLIWEYQLVFGASRWHLLRTQWNSLSVSPPQSPLAREDFLEAVRSLAVGCRAALCLPLPPCDVLLVWAELSSALWVLAQLFALRGTVVLHRVSCAVCHKGCSGKSGSAPCTHTTQSTGLVCWISGPLAYCAFGSWGCEAPARLIPAALCLPAVLFGL